MFILSIHERLAKLLACVALLFVVLVVTDTYSKYLSEATGTTTVDVARWRILVNGQDIRNSSTLSQVITPTLYSNNHIAQDIIAPTSQGYFDIIINCADADVSFEYEINMSSNTNSSVQDFIATGYSIDGGTTTSLDRGDDITGQVLLSSHTSTINIRVYVEWDDDSEDAVMDNAADTAATNTNNLAILDVNLSFTQIPDTQNNNNNNNPDTNEP